jgi:hypothetical protein
VNAGFDLGAAAEQMRQYQDRVRSFELFNGEIPRSVPARNEPRIAEPPRPPFWQCPDCDYTFGPHPHGWTFRYVAHKCPSRR